MTANPDDDRPLVEAAQADPARFVELYDRYVSRIYAFVSRRVPDRAAAEDITSAVFEQALSHLGRFEWRGVPFAAWLFTPFLHVRGAAGYIEYLKQAFGAVEERREGSAARINYARLRIGDAALELGDADGEAEPMPGGFYLYVDQVDQLYERALAAGGTSIWAPADQPYGDRVGAVEDAMGNQWFIARPAERT